MLSADTTDSSSTAIQTSYPRLAPNPPAALDDVVLLVPDETGRTAPETRAAVARDLDIVVEAADEGCDLTPTLSLSVVFDPVDDEATAPTHAIHVDEASLPELVSGLWAEQFATTAATHYRRRDDRVTQAREVKPAIQEVITDLGELMQTGRVLSLSSSAYRFVASSLSVRYVPPASYEVAIATKLDHTSDLVCHLSADEWTSTSMSRRDGSLSLPARPAEGPQNIDCRDRLDYGPAWPVLRRCWGLMLDADEEPVAPAEDETDGASR